MSQDPYRMPPEPPHRGPAPGRRPDRPRPDDRLPARRPQAPVRRPDFSEQPTTVLPPVAPQPTRRYEPPPVVSAPPPVEYRPREQAYEPVEYRPREPVYEPTPVDHRPREQAYEPPPSADDHPAPRYRQQQESPLDYQRERDRRADRTNLIAGSVRVLTTLIALVFVLHIVFTLFDANQDNGFVAFVYGAAKVFVFGFGDVFTPDDATIGLVANYGLAAIVYLVVGRVIYRTLRH